VPDTPYAVAAVALCVAHPLRTSAVVHCLNARMPVGVMLILTVYTLCTLSLAAPRHPVAPAVALAVTLGRTTGRTTPC